MENPNIKKEFRDELMGRVEGSTTSLSEEQIKKLMDALYACGTVAGGGGGSSTDGDPQFKAPDSTDRKATTFERWIKVMTDIVNSFDDVEKALTSIQSRISQSPTETTNPGNPARDPSDYLMCMNIMVDKLGKTRDSIRSKVKNIAEFI